MTQMMILPGGTQAPAAGPLAAVTTGSIHFSRMPVRVYLYPLASIEQARDEAPDAANFVLDTCCTECAQDGRGARQNTCDSCNVAGCYCEVQEGPHGQGMACADCYRICNCYDCEA